MSAIWEVPVASPAERALGVTRRMLRVVPDGRMPRDTRPPRARRERMPEQLRRWGAAPRRADG